MKQNSNIFSEIYIYENLSADEISKLQEFNPFMDINYDFSTSSFNFKVFDNQSGEKKIRFFEHDHIKQGLVVLDFEIIKDLFLEIKNNNRFVFKDKKYDTIFEYVRINKNHVWYYVAVPVKSFINYAKTMRSKRLLLNLDDDLLKKYNL